MNVRRVVHPDGRVTYILRTDYGYGDSMEVTPKDMMGFGAYLVGNESQVVDDALHDDVLAAMKEVVIAKAEGTMDYGSGRYNTISGRR